MVSNSNKTVNARTMRKLGANNIPPEINKKVMEWSSHASEYLIKEVQEKIYLKNTIKLLEEQHATQLKTLLAKKDEELLSEGNRITKRELLLVLSVLGFLTFLAVTGVFKAWYFINHDICLRDCLKDAKTIPLDTNIETLKGFAIESCILLFLPFLLSSTALIASRSRILVGKPLWQKSKWVLLGLLTWNLVLWIVSFSSIVLSLLGLDRAPDFGLISVLFFAGVYIFNCYSIFVGKKQTLSPQLLDSHEGLSLEMPAETEDEHFNSLVELVKETIKEP